MIGMPGRNFAENTEFEMHTNETLCRRWVEEVWNDGREEAIDELFAEDGDAVYPYFIVGDDRLAGREAFKKFFRIVRSQIEALHVRLSDISADDEKVVAICEITGKVRAGDGSNSRDVAIRSLCLYKFNDGLIREIWNNVELDESDIKNYKLKVDRD